MVGGRLLCRCQRSVIGFCGGEGWMVGSCGMAGWQDCMLVGDHEWCSVIGGTFGSLETVLAGYQ